MRCAEIITSVSKFDKYTPIALTKGTFKVGIIVWTDIQILSAFSAL